ncbi:MAG: exodeoxyribonuclease VII small subunit [Acidobacteriota bacterium]
MPEEKSGSEIEIKDFEAALTRLETIVQTLEAGNLPLEEAMKLFEEGMNLARFCTQKLEEAERKVEILVKGPKGDLVAEPFQAEDADEGRESDEPD